MQCDDKKEDEDHRAKMIDFRIKISSIPKRQLLNSFDNFEKTKAIDKFNMCKYFAKNWEETKKNGRSIFMLGTVGGGKTHLACAIANYVILNYLAKVKYTTFSRLSLEMRDAQNQNKSLVESMNVFTKCDLLIIDEIGVKNTSEYEFSLLNEIVDSRYNNILPTILITNMNWKEIRKVIGERVISRLTENGESLVFKNNDFRKLKR